MMDIQILHIMHAKQIGEKLRQESFQPIIRSSNENETLPWHLHAQVYGLPKSKVCPYTSDILTNCNKTTSAKQNNLRFLGTEHRFESPTSYSNLNKISYEQWVKSQSISSKNRYFCTNRQINAQITVQKIKPKSEHGVNSPLRGSEIGQVPFQPDYVFENFQNNCSNKRAYIVDLQNCDKSSIYFKTSLCRTVSHSNMDICKSFGNQNNLNIQKLLQARSIVNIEKHRQSKPTSENSQKDILDLFDPLNIKHERECNFRNNKDVESVKLKIENHEGCNKNEVSILFLTKLFRQIHDLSTKGLRKKENEMGFRQTRIKFKRHQKRTQTTANSLDMSVDGNYSNLNASFVVQNDFEFAAGTARQLCLMYTTHQVRQVCTQSNHAIDIHKVRKWHSGMLKIGERLFSF